MCVVFLFFKNTQLAGRFLYIIHNKSARLMPTCTDTLMGLNSHFGGKVQKVKKNISLYLQVTESIKAHSTMPRAQ